MAYAAGIPAIPPGMNALPAALLTTARQLHWTGTCPRVTGTVLRWHLPSGEPVPIGIERAPDT